MSNLYLDEIEKIKFYKQRISEKLISYGLAANKEQVQQELDNLDLKLAIFSQAYINSGSQFSVEKFNEQKKDIYNDLVILYRLVYHLAEQRIEKARIRIRYALDDLRTDAKCFQYVTDSQTVSVYGKTVFNQSSNFAQEYQDGQVIIDLGPVTVSSGSYLAPIFVSDETDPEDVSFIFIDENDNKAQTAVYNYAKNYVKVVGNYQLSVTPYTYEDKIFGKELISIDEEVDENCQYNLFLNKNQLRVKKLDGTGMRYVKKEPGVYYTTEDREEISFYVYGASFIQLHQVGNIEYKNFVGTDIVTPRQRQKIVLRGENFSFDIKTDGVIYAEKIPAVIQDKQLAIGQNFENISDYMVETINYGDDITFNNVRVVIDNVTHALYDIQYIVIKQARISELEDME